MKKNPGRIAEYNKVFFIPNNFSILLIFSSNNILKRLNPAPIKPLYLTSIPTIPANDW